MSDLTRDELCKLAKAAGWKRPTTVTLRKPPIRDLVFEALMNLGPGKEMALVHAVDDAIFKERGYSFPLGDWRDRWYTLTIGPVLVARCILEVTNDQG